MTRATPNFHHIETQKRSVRPTSLETWNESPYPKATPPRAKMAATVDALEKTAAGASRGQGVENGVSLGGIAGGTVGLLVAIGGALTGSLEIAMVGGLMPIIAVTLGGIFGAARPDLVTKS